MIKRSKKLLEDCPGHASLQHKSHMAFAAPPASISPQKNGARIPQGKTPKEINHKARVLTPLILYSIFYGAFIINIIDLGLPIQDWFHIFLTIAYFSPSIILLIILGWRSWDLALAIGLLISLMNDLFYAPVGNLLAATNYDLARWYARQLGLLGSEPAWFFRAGIIFFRTTSLIIGISIYIRFIAACILILEWWRK
ncbi:MAG: hypothetical protein QXO15_12875 [Nitrososphaerota archaeon]